MIVVDASVVVDLLLDRGPRGRRIASLIAGEPLAAPALALSALDDLIRLRLTRHSHAMVLARAFELRDNATMYDALYLALAELLGATFVTRDQALAQIPASRLGSR